MPKGSDITGMIFGELEVLGRDGKGGWLCRCSCGNEKSIKRNDLTRGASTNCGHRKNLSGQSFGEWKVLQEDPEKRYYYRCVCSCGVERSVFGSSLVNGSSPSCGHLRVEKRNRNLEAQRNALVGEKFGMLTVISVRQEKGQDARARCVCACGNKKEILFSTLFNGQTKSCGCFSSQLSSDRLRYRNSSGKGFVK